MKVTALIIIVAVSGCASTGAVRASQVAFVGANVADLHSTRVALGAGAVEANPMLGQSVWQQLAVKTATTVGTVWLSERLSQRHRTLTTALLTALSITYGVIAGHNYRLGRR